MTGVSGCGGVHAAIVGDNRDLRVDEGLEYGCHTEDGPATATRNQNPCRWKNRIETEESKETTKTQNLWLQYGKRRIIGKRSNKKRIRY